GCQATAAYNQENPPGPTKMIATLADAMRKPRTTYQLGSRQAREVYKRGFRLSIAIPVPPEADEDTPAIVVAKLSMPAESDLIASAEYLTLPVAIPSPSSSAIGTERHFGKIVDD